MTKRAYGKGERSRMKLINCWGNECDGVRIPEEDLRHMVNTSLRYALGAKNYITGLTSDILCALPLEVWDERTWVVAMRDLRRYFYNRETMDERYRDGACDLREWQKLYNHLLPMYEAVFLQDTNISIIKDKRNENNR